VEDTSLFLYTMFPVLFGIRIVLFLSSIGGDITLSLMLLLLLLLLLLLRVEGTMMYHIDIFPRREY